jgi:putative PEP-CTERM system TPR-repeat lipoprotein
MKKIKTSRFPLIVLGLVLAAGGCSGQTADELMTKARQAAAAGDVRTAQIHLKNLLRDEPNNAAARALLGQTSLAVGDLAAAEADLRKALDLGADPASIQLPLVRVLISEGRFTDALQQIEKGPELQGENKVTELRLQGAAHRALKQSEQAEAAYRAAIAADPDSLAAKADLASFLLEQRREAEARDVVVQVLEKQPNFGPALLVRGRMEMAARRVKDAEATFRQVIEAEGPRGDDYFSASAQLIDVLLVEDSVDAAAALADKLISNYPRHPIAIVLKATVEMKTGQLDAARQRLEPVVAAAPTFGPANRLLGIINAKQGRTQQAQMYLQSALTNDPNDGQALLHLAAVQLGQGNTEGARKLLAGAVNKEKPQSDSVLFALGGLASLRAGQDDIAPVFFEQSARNLSDDPQEIATVASVYAASGELERAQKLLEGASAEQGEKAWAATYVLALTQIRKGDFKAADAAAARLAEQQPKSPWPLNLRGMVAVLAKDLPAARRYYSAALDRDSKYLPAMLNLARVDVLERKPDDAAKTYRRVLSVDPKQPDALLSLAQLALNKRDYAESKKLLDEVPDSVARTRMLGALALAQNQFDEAADLFAQAFDKLPTSDTALQAFGAAQRAQRPNSEAPLLTWVAEHPRDASVNFVLGMVSLQKGDRDAAIARFQTVVEAEPKHADALNNLAWLYGEKKDPRAFEFARRAHEAAPENPAIADTLGWLEVQQGDAANGLALLEESHKALPDNPAIRYHWAAALAKNGSKQKAVDALRDLLAGDTRFEERGDAERLLDTLQ